MTQEALHLTQEWDKTFAPSSQVTHRKVTFHNRYGITLAADLYQPADAAGPLPALAVCGLGVGRQRVGIALEHLAARELARIDGRVEHNWLILGQQGVAHGQPWHDHEPLPLRKVSRRDMERHVERNLPATVGHEFGNRRTDRDACRGLPCGASREPARQADHQPFSPLPICLVISHKPANFFDQKI